MPYSFNLYKFLNPKAYKKVMQEMHDAEVRAKAREEAIDECIKIIEETVWKDAEMLVENIREFTKAGAL